MLCLDTIGPSVPMPSLQQGNFQLLKIGLVLETRCASTQDQSWKCSQVELDNFENGQVYVSALHDMKKNGEISPSKKCQYFFTLSTFITGF